MKTFIFCLLISFSSTLLSQSLEKKQITNFDFNSRNPVFVSEYGPEFIFNEEIFFEGEKDSAINIYALKYDISSDSFYQLIQITSNSLINRKPVVKNVYNYDSYHAFKILLWETNQNRNWDIKYSIDSGYGWVENRFLINTDEDELDPSFIFSPRFYYFDFSPFQFVFSRNNSVFLFTKDSIETEELIFRGNDSVKYSDPVICIYEKFYAAAVRTVNGNDPRIVFRVKDEKDTSWSEIKELYKRAPAVNPKFVDFDYGPALSFEVLFNNKRKVLFKRIEDFETENPIIELLDDQNLETSDFNNYEYPIITKKSSYESYYPYSFRYVKNDSAFIRSGPDYGYYPAYKEFYSRIYNFKSALGYMGYNNGIVTYTIWEDSSKDNRINLFGIKRINPYGDVNDGESDLTSYKLFQNYPNPFNPSTQIEFQVFGTGFVTLKIYDILGKEIAVLVNEEKNPGVYKIKFNAEKYNLPSGIYFYKLAAGSFIQTKKMILLK